MMEKLEVTYERSGKTFQHLYIETLGNYECISYKDAFTQKLNIILFYLIRMHSPLDTEAKKCFGEYGSPDIASVMS